MSAKDREEGMGYGNPSLPLGCRVELHPARNEWMRGDRYGEIVYHRLGRGENRYGVRLDKSGRVLTLAPSSVREV